MGSRVLILILLEYGLRQLEFNLKVETPFVLILILLEYGLRQGQGGAPVLASFCLNPYSIGIWSATVIKNELGYYSVS